MLTLAPKRKRRELGVVGGGGVPPDLHRDVDAVNGTYRNLVGVLFARGLGADSKPEPLHQAAQHDLGLEKSKMLPQAGTRPINEACWLVGRFGGWLERGERSANTDNQTGPEALQQVPSQA
jgi:hypothetical protein